MNAQDHGIFEEPHRSGGPRFAAIVIAALAVGGVACASSEPAATQEAPTPTVLRVDLPPGLRVHVDAAEVGVTPLAEREVEAGAHAIRVATPCGEFSAEVEAKAEATTKVASEAFEGLGFATLRVRAKSLQGAELPIVAKLGDWEAPAGKDGGFTVPACKLRLHVGSEGLGGFVEDIELSAGKTIEREVVLAPGPDMVRIHGGPFTLGPPQRLIDEWKSDADFAAMMDQRITIRIPTQIATFDLDRHEVTAAQFQACRAATKNQNNKHCYSPQECAEMGGCPDDVMNASGDVFEPGSAFAKESIAERCNAGLPGAGERKAKEGREDHPMNCVARWEAEAYCRWVGKRLPTQAEWEYAARSGQEEYEYPWGSQPADCARAYIGGCRGARGTLPVCSYPTGNSEHGVCDLMASMSEYVTPNAFPDRREHALSVLQEFVTGDDIYGLGLGFRCARDVKPQ